MDVDVVTEILIDRPVEEVAAFAADPDNAPAWYEGIESVEWQTPKDLAVGAQITFVAAMHGRPVRYTCEIVEYLPGQSLVMRTLKGIVPIETVCHWQAQGDATRMTLRSRGKPSGFAALLQPMMQWAMRKANRKSLATLKHLLESKSG